MNSTHQYRYLRHLDLPQLGFAGQEKIAKAHITLVGMGGLGAASSLYLAGAGVGTLSLIDFDAVDENNLQRQILYKMKDVGNHKTHAAYAHLTALNPSITIVAHKEKLDAANAEELLHGTDIILDGSDNFATRYLLNSLSIRLGKTLISASVQGFAGQIGVFKPQAGHACYQCLFPQTPPKGMVPTCPEAGVFGPLVGVMGTLQAGEALKEVAGLNRDEATRFFSLDLLTLKTTLHNVERNPHCPACGSGVKLRA